MTRKTLAFSAVAAACAACILAVPQPPARGQDAPPSVPEPATAPAGPFKNVEILTWVTSKTEMRRIMREQAAALGVKCTHCHVPGQFHLDDKKEKRLARDMMRMVARLNETVFADFEEKPAVTCWTCHRGSTEVEREVPRSAFDQLDAQVAP